jgi:hypothetical protein
MQGKHFPGKSDKDGIRRGAKASQNINSSEETGEKVCLVCTQLRSVPEWTFHTHTTQECGRLANYNKQAGARLDACHSHNGRLEIAPGEETGTIQLSMRQVTSWDSKEGAAIIFTLPWAESTRPACPSMRDRPGWTMADSETLFDSERPRKDSESSMHSGRRRVRVVSCVF